MKRRNRAAVATLMASTSIVALSLVVAPVVLPPDLGGATSGYAASDSCCFIAGTAVLMADGSTRPIEAIRPGDLVRGGRGGVNRVVAVEAPRLGARRLYGFNGGVPFVTAEHPFLTPAGWKAVDPAATLRETAALKVTALAPGDLLTRARPAGPATEAGNLARATAVEVWLDPLKVLAAAEADPATIVYNLLLDGDHSYIADGFIVHNKGDDDGDGDDDDGGDDDGGDDDGGDDDGGDDGGDDDGGDDDGGGDDGGGDDGGDDDGGDDGGDDDGGDDDDTGDDDDDDDTGDEFFRGDPGAAGGDLSPAEEAELIERGWQ